MKRLLTIILALLLPSVAAAQYRSDYIRGMHQVGDKLNIRSHQQVAGTWSCLAADKTCTCTTANGDATTSLAAGAAILMLVGSDWKSYTVESVTDDDNFEREDQVTANITDPLESILNSAVYRINLGFPNASGEYMIMAGTGEESTLWLAEPTLDDASGDEIAAKIVYECDKAADDCRGLRIETTDTASPDLNYPLSVGKVGEESFYVTETGGAYAGSFNAGSFTPNSTGYLLAASGIQADFTWNIAFSNSTHYYGTKVVDLFSYDDPQGVWWIAIGDGSGETLSDISGTGLIADYVQGLTPVVGEMYSNAATVTCTTAGSYYGITDLTEGEIAGAPFLTTDVADATGDHFTIGASGAGQYLVNANFAFSSPDNAAVMDCDIFVDDVEFDKCGFQRTIGTAGAFGAASFTCILDLAATEEIDIQCKSDGNGDVLYFNNVNVNIYRLN